MRTFSVSIPFILAANPHCAAIARCRWRLVIHFFRLKGQHPHGTSHPPPFGSCCVCTLHMFVCMSAEISISITVYSWACAIMAADTLCCTELGVELSTEGTQIHEMHSTETLDGEVGSVAGNMQAKLKTEPGLLSNFTYKYSTFAIYITILAANLKHLLCR